MKNKLASMKRRSALLFSVILSGILVLGLIINVIWPDRDHSNVESRPLQTFPALQLQSLEDGSWTRNMTNWFSDQFVGRNLYFHLNYLLKKGTGIRKIDDVYLGKGALIQEAGAPNEALMSQKAQTIQAFHARFPLNTSVMIVPTAAQIDQDKLPPFAPGAFEQQTIDSFYSQLPEDIHALDVGKTLEKNQNKYQYYKTDHHWTSLGAYHAAKQFLKSQGMEIAYSDYERMPVSNSFRGTLESKTGSVFLKDTIDIYVAKNNPDYLVTYNNDGNPVPTIYDDEALHRKDQYEVFFGGNDSLVQINLNTDSTRHLLIFKDSYANSMIQFLLPYYRSITIVDPRYYYDDITRLIESDMITDVLFLYNYNSFQTDTSLLDVLNSAIQTANQ